MTLAIIGCGNSNRSDDGVGVFVAQALMARLRTRPRSDVRVFDVGTGGMEVMFQARGVQKLVVVDASRSGSPPGAIFDVPGAELQRDHAPSFSLHDFRWEHALAAGRRIFREQFPGDVSVVLIEAERLDFGLELSEPVRASAARVIARWRDSSMATVPPHEDPLASAGVAAGNLYLAREACERFLPGIESIALLDRASRVLILPLTRESGGGLLLKVRNARGDRVIHAQEFFRAHGYVEAFEPRQVAMQWDASAAALVLTGVPRAP